MSKLLMESLKMDLPALADMIRSKGRGRDTILAHITPREAALLKKRGGSGTTNPDTGLPEFEDGGFDVGSYFGGDTGGAFTPTEGASFQAPAASPDLAPITPAQTPKEAQLAQARYGFSSGGGQYTNLPGELGNIPAYTPYGGEPQLVSRGADGSIQYGFPQSGILPPTNVVTPTPSELTQLQAGGPQDISTLPSTPKTEQQSMLEKLGLQPKDLTRMGLGALLTGGLAATNISRTRQAQQQAQQTQAQQQALATPYQEMGKQQIAQAQAGQLTPQSQAAYQAAQARINQNIANRGGVGVQQAANELANIYQSLLANQYQLGQQIMNIGDNYALGAIKTGLQANQAVNQANQNFYQALAQMAAPFLMGQAPVYQVSGRGA